MLFLLRQIRRKLLMKNKVTTYLLYGIGEIILVVIGILIAVQLDNWNESKNDRKKELSYLVSYANDIKQNIEELERVDLRSARLAKTADSLIHILITSENDNKESTLGSLIIDLIGYTKYLSQEGTTENLLGAGSLEIIQNLKIRASFVTQEADEKRLRASELYMFSAFNEYMDYVNKNTKIYNDRLGKPIVDKTILKLLSNDTYFLNIIDDLSIIYRESNENYVTRKKQLKDLLKIVEAEIQKLES